MHRVKYHGMGRAAEVLADLMAPLIPPESAALVPVPRAVVRRGMYGIDPAWELARLVSNRTGIAAVRALRSPMWWPRHAGAAGPRRGSPAFGLARPVTGPIVLIDDVATSGATLAGAVAVLGRAEVRAVTATSPGMMATSKAPTAAGRLRDSTAAW